MRRILLVVALLFPLTLLLWAASQNPSVNDEIDTEAGARSAALNAERDALIAGASDQVSSGAEHYDLVCAACHGDTGLGYAEAVIPFPASHQRCSRCHRPTNADRIDGMVVTEIDSFHLGDPPALRGPGTLTAFADGSSLYHFIRAAMPRHAPGSLDDDVYLDLTVMLLALRGEIPAGASLSADELAEIELHRP